MAGVADERCFRHRRAERGGKKYGAISLLPTIAWPAHFVNADEIARGLSPFDPEECGIAAGRILIEQIGRFVQTRRELCLRDHVRRPWPFATLRRVDPRVSNDTDFSVVAVSRDGVARVAQRVREGGHSVPEDVVIRRYAAGLRNMRHHFLPLVDVAIIYDNSEGGRLLIAGKASGFHVHRAQRPGVGA